MRVAVIGLGSMGKRRIRLIKQIDENIEIIGVDLNDCLLIKFAPLVFRFLKSARAVESV